MAKKLFCDNDVVLSTKNCNLQQLRLFYSMLYKGKLNWIRKDDGNSRMIITREEIIDIFGEVSSNIVRDIIYGMPNQVKFADDKFDGFISVFDEVKFNTNTLDIYFSINELFYDKYLVDLFGNFTILDLEILIRLKSIYGQRMYEIYRRWNNIGKKTYSIEEFREIFDVPECYKAGNIDQAVINVALKDLTKVGINISVSKNKRGKYLTGYTFSYPIDRIGG